MNKKQAEKFQIALETRWKSVADFLNKLTKNKYDFRVGDLEEARIGHCDPSETAIRARTGSHRGQFNVVWLADGFWEFDGAVFKNWSNLHDLVNNNRPRKITLSDIRRAGDEEWYTNNCHPTI